MKQTKTVATMIFSGFLALLISGNAAADWSWDLSWFDRTGELNRSGSGAGAPGVKVRGYSNATEAWYTSSNYGKGNLVRRDIQGWSGAGVYSPAVGNDPWGYDNDRSSPYHGVDNMYHIDSILLDFGGKSVALSEVALPYTGMDSDFMLTAYIGNDGAANETDLTNLEYSELTSSGWETVGDYFDAVGTKAVNPSEISSSLWLITALNPWKNGEPRYYSHFFDAFKVGGVSAKAPTTTTIPEPATILLLGSALLMMGIRRKQMQSQEACAIKA